jgi:hypothetical protein
MRTVRRQIVDREIDKSIEDLRDLLDAVSESPILSGVHIENVVLVDGVPKDIYHGLGRKYRNFLYGSVEGATTSGLIQRVATGDDSKYVRLQADDWGATITVRLWVY